jgi:hypothetical protein
VLPLSGLAGESAVVATLPALSAAETRAAEALLARAWGPGTSVRAAEPIWDRSHVVRLQLATGRSVVMTWLRSFTSAAGRSGVLPGLRVLASGLHERLSARWPEAVTADCPALARPGSAQVQVPDFWQPEV